MERIVKGRSATLTKTFTFTPTGTPTVALTRVSDGTTVTAGSVSGATTTWSYTIPATSNTLLDTYVETWTAVTGGVSQSFTDYIDVAGDVLFTLADARTLKPLDDAVTYTDAKIADGRTYAEQKLERECGMAFVPRYELRTVSGDGSTSLCLRYPTRSIRSVSTVDSAGTLTAYTAGQLAALRTDGIAVYNPAGWTCGTANIVIGYEHGLDVPPSGATEAALLLAKQKAVRGPVDDRATQRPTEFGPINLATPGMFGSITGLPDVDEFIRGTRVPGIA